MDKFGFEEIALENALEQPGVVQIAHLEVVHVDRHNARYYEFVNNLYLHATDNVMQCMVGNKVGHAFVRYAKTIDEADGIAQDISAQINGNG